MDNSRIPVILTVYNKPDFFEKQLQNLCEQTCINDIDLYVISNNPSIDYNSVLKKFDNKIKFTFIQKHNQYGPFERHLYAFENKFEYVILLDDDVILEKSDVQTIFNSRENKTIKSGWLRIWGEMGKLPYAKYEYESPGSTEQEYNHFGAGLSIIDCSIYEYVMQEFNKLNEDFLNKHKLNIILFDDMFIAWIANRYNYRITSHGIFCNLQDHKNALWKKIVQNKNFMVETLDSIHPWKRIIHKKN